jgi:hypothetical protein
VAGATSSTSRGHQTGSGLANCIKMLAEGQRIAQSAAMSALGGGFKRSLQHRS